MTYTRYMDMLSFLFPRRCLGCGEIGSYLCPNCVNSLKPITNLYCPVCRHLSFYGTTHRSCRKHLTLDGLISCYTYQGLMKRIIGKFKYHFVSDLTQTLIELMISNAAYPLFTDRTWSIVPIPLHPQRLRWRGFNQAEILAKGLADNWQFPCYPQLLERVRNTTAQMSLSGKERRQNLHLAFNCTAQLVPSRILIIDDVATTCSTLCECAKVLKQAGAQEVWGLTLAQTIPK